MFTYIFTNAIEMVFHNVRTGYKGVCCHETKTKQKVQRSLAVPVRRRGCRVKPKVESRVLSCVCVEF